MATQWYVTIEGEQKGPLTDTEVHRWVDDGRISHDTFVRVGIDGEWQPAGDHVGLFDPQQKEALAETLPTEDKGTPFIQTGFARSNSTRSRSQRAPSFFETYRRPIVIGLGCLPVALVLGIVFWNSGDNRRTVEHETNNVVVEPVEQSPDDAWRKFVSNFRAKAANTKTFSWSTQFGTVGVTRNIAVVDSQEPGVIVISVTSNKTRSGEIFSATFDCFFQWRDGEWQAEHYRAREKVNDGYYMPVEQLLGL